jgi:hypothetical protein
MKVLNGFVLGIAALTDKFLHQGHEGIELLVWYRRIVANRGNNLNGRVQGAFRERGMRRCTVVAVVLYACREQNQLTIPSVVVISFFSLVRRSSAAYTAVDFSNGEMIRRMF